MAGTPIGCTKSYRVTPIQVWRSRLGAAPQEWIKARGTREKRKGERLCYGAKRLPVKFCERSPSTMSTVAEENRSSRVVLQQKTLARREPKNANVARMECKGHRFAFPKCQQVLLDPTLCKGESRMHEVKRIRISGFRRLRDVNIEMRSLMVLIGANGVGKSSILDAVSLLSSSAAGTMNKSLNDIGGVADACTRGKTDKIAFEAEMAIEDESPLLYQLEVQAKHQGYAIPKEILSQVRRGKGHGPFIHIESHDDNIMYYDVGDRHLGRPDWEHNPLESSLSQVPKMFRHPEELRRTLSSVTKYHVLDVGPRAPVKLPQQMKPSLLPGEDGEDLVPFLYALREGDRDRYEVIEDTLRAAFPDFESLNFPPVAAGMLSLTWKDRAYRDPMYVHQLSEGTLRFLWLISLLQSPNLSTVTMIDEPEVSLHPELLSLLADLMREAAKRTQIIVATHSDRLIRFLDPKEVVVMDVDDDGCAAVQWADSMDLDEWLKEYSLDEVWRMGRMGGRA